MTEIERLKFWLRLLEMENDALKSVISELDYDDERRASLTQWHKVRAIEEFKNHLVRPMG